MSDQAFDNLVMLVGYLLLFVFVISLHAFGAWMGWWEDEPPYIDEEVDFSLDDD